MSNKQVLRLARLLRQVCDDLDTYLDTIDDTDPNPIARGHKRHVAAARAALAKVQQS
jgi:hypothetical protein